MKVDKKWVWAKLNLAIHFNLHMLKRIFSSRTKVDGFAEFKENYLADNVFELNLHEGELIRDLSRCINCGQCMAVCPVRSQIKTIVDPSSIAISYSRNLPELGSIKDVLASCEICPECEEVCPKGVPLMKMVEFLRQKAGQLIVN